jgi:hypothetical protein
MCGAVILVLGWAIHDEITTPNIQTGTRAGWLAATIVVELVMLVGLQRLWVVCLIVDEAGLTVRNFRGDIHVRRSEIKSVDQSADIVGFGVELRLKIGDKIRVDGLTWPTPGPVEQALADIRKTLGMAPAELPADIG